MSEEDGLDLVTLAVMGYAAYSKEADYKTFDDKPIPTWDQLGPKIQARWIANAKAIKDAVLQVYQGDHR